MKVRKAGVAMTAIALLLVSNAASAEDSAEDSVNNTIFNLGLLAVYAKECGQLSTRGKQFLSEAVTMFGPESWRSGTAKAEALRQINGNRLFCEAVRQTHPTLAR